MLASGAVGRMGSVLCEQRSDRAFPGAGTQRGLLVVILHCCALRSALWAWRVNVQCTSGCRIKGGRNRGRPDTCVRTCRGSGCSGSTLQVLSTRAVHRSTVWGTVTRRQGTVAAEEAGGCQPRQEDHGRLSCLFLGLSALPHPPSFECSRKKEATGSGTRPRLGPWAISGFAIMCLGRWQD